VIDDDRDRRFTMTDAVVRVLIPYARFLECRRRRSGVRLELARQDAQRQADEHPLAAAAATTDRAPAAALVLRPDSTAGLDKA
jgi:hypothetical protein